MAFAVPILSKNDESHQNTMDFTEFNCFWCVKCLDLHIGVYLKLLSVASSNNIIIIVLVNQFHYRWGLSVFMELVTFQYAQNAFNTGRSIYDQTSLVDPDKIGRKSLANATQDMQLSHCIFNYKFIAN